MVHILSWHTNISGQLVEAFSSGQTDVHTQVRLQDLQQFNVNSNQLIRIAAGGITEGGVLEVADIKLAPSRTRDGFKPGEFSYIHF